MLDLVRLVDRPNLRERLVRQNHYNFLLPRLHPFISSLSRTRKPQKTHPKTLGRDSQLVHLLVRVPACSQWSIELYPKVHPACSSHYARKVLPASRCVRRARGEGECREEGAAFGRGRGGSGAGELGGRAGGSRRGG